MCRREAIPSLSPHLCFLQLLLCLWEGGPSFTPPDCPHLLGICGKWSGDSDHDSTLSHLQNYLPKHLILFEPKSKGVKIRDSHFKILSKLTRCWGRHNIQIKGKESSQLETAFYKRWGRAAERWGPAKGTDREWLRSSLSSTNPPKGTSFFINVRPGGASSTAAQRCHPG